MAGSVLIGLALFSIRSLSSQFHVGTTTDEHPVFLLIGCLLFAGMVWLLIILILRKHIKTCSKLNIGRLTVSGIIIGLALRALFFGSTPVYEDDWNRYLWDGAVITQGISPYAYSPDDVLDYSGANKDLQTLSTLSVANGDFVQRINNSHLTTIYPPVAQAVFAIGAVIKPFDINVLRALYWVSELLALLLMVKVLALFGRPTLWVWLYALNPMVIFTAFNGLHMDILLVPLFLGAIGLSKARPIGAAIVLAAAVAIKLWPLLLGPVLFRSHRRSFAKYLGYGILLGIVSLLLCLPMLWHLGEGSGLSAYSVTWQRSSFLFPYIETLLASFSDHSTVLSRVLIAIITGGVAMWYGLKREGRFADLPFVLLVITLTLYLLSPTGFPWYVIWFAFLIPFVPSFGVGLLCVTVALYYARFWLGEGGQYDIYLNVLVPLQFGFPIIILLFEGFRARRYGRL